MPKNLLDYTRDELQAQLDEHMPLRPEPRGPISELLPSEYRDYMKALELWNDRKNALELGLFLKREKSGPVVAVDYPARGGHDRTCKKPAPAQVQAPPHIQTEHIKETPMPKPVDLDEFVRRYNQTLANMPALEADEQAWEQAKRRAYDLRWKIRDTAKKQGVTAPELADLPPSPFTTQGVHKRIAERPVMPVHVEGGAKPKPSAEPEDDEAAEVTLEDLVERIQDCRQEIASILSDAQLLQRSERAALSIDMSELVVVANGCDAALAAVG